MSKTLVAYFSASGVTKNLAQRIAKLKNSDLFEIRPKVPYSDADLNWMDKNSRSSVEMSDKNSRPEIAELCENLSDYETVFLGFPIWWYIAPTIINTFLESHDFVGKKIIPFATSGGSDVGDTDEWLHKSASKSMWIPAKRISVNISDEALENILKNYNN